MQFVAVFQSRNYFLVCLRKEETMHACAKKRRAQHVRVVIEITPDSAAAAAATGWATNECLITAASVSAEWEKKEEKRIVFCSISWLLLLLGCAKTSPQIGSLFFLSSLLVGLPLLSSMPTARWAHVRTYIGKWVRWKMYRSSHGSIIIKKSIFEQSHSTGSWARKGWGVQCWIHRTRTCMYVRTSRH